MHLLSAILPLILVWSIAVSAASEEEPPATPKQQVEELMNEGIEFAEQMLREHGEFLPFGVACTTDGSIQHVGATDGREHPPSQDLIDILNAGFRKAADAGEYSATAIFLDVLVTPPGSSTRSDAVQVGLEHRSGYCADVFFPYRRHADGTVEFGELFASKRDGVVFRCQ